MPILTLLLLPGLVVLFWLGTWQLGRYQYKNGLPPVPAEEVQSTLQGTLETDRIFWLYTTFEGESLWRAYRLLDGCSVSSTATETCDRPVFVNTGLLSAIEPPEGIELSVQDVTDQSYILISNFPKGFLRPADNPDALQWYTPNAPKMAEAAGLAGADRAVLAEPASIPIIRLDGAGNQTVTGADNPYANPAVADDMPPARHLGYSLTWYGLALAMLGVYFALHVSRGRLRFGTKPETDRGQDQGSANQ
tara:strand:- start:20241 stop:20987 length:747 start_codon:yes stop_codon:yes gene_type:complete